MPVAILLPQVLIIEVVVVVVVVVVAVKIIHEEVDTMTTADDGRGQGKLDQENP